LVTAIYISLYITVSWWTPWSSPYDYNDWLQSGG